MTQPRCIRPGRIWMVTRRATRRHFLFRPDRDGRFQQIYWYVTAVIAAKFGIELHAVQVMSTHIHEVLTDVRGELPAFLRERNRILANVLKCHRDWPEEVFQRAPANCIELFGPEAIAKQIAYTLANCVEAGLVNRPEEWPGVTVCGDEIGKRVVEVERPNLYFDSGNLAWPAKATIAITMPSALTNAHGPSAPEVLRRVVDAAVELARVAARKAGRVVRSVERLFDVPFTGRAVSDESSGEREPTFAAGGNAERVRDALADRRAFRERYRAAMDALRGGAREVAFPAGTWRWCRELMVGRAATSQGEGGESLRGSKALERQTSMLVDAARLQAG